MRGLECFYHYRAAAAVLGVADLRQICFHSAVH
jgi:hypothetical protein